MAECTGDFRIRNILKGWSWEAGYRGDTRQPLSPTVLKSLHVTWEGVCISAYETALFHSAVLVTFLGVLRAGECVASLKNDTSGRALVLQDIQLTAKEACIRIRSFKMDKARLTRDETPHEVTLFSALG